MILATLFLACSTPRECPPAAECPKGEVLADWESAILKDDLVALRRGVTPAAEIHLGESATAPGPAFGVCKGTRECGSFLGPNPGELPAGDHTIQAELMVPNLGKGWKVRFQVHCDVTTPQGRTTTYDHDKNYDVTYIGPTRAYPLRPLWRIQSPHPQGSRSCKYTLTPLRPDGVEGTPIEGSYATAMPAGDEVREPPAPGKAPAAPVKKK